MKSILYVGATLMIGASIYGFVDYKQSSQQKAFKTMYTEEEAIVPAVSADETVVPDMKAEETKQTSRAVTKRKNVKEDEVFQGVKPIPADQQLKSEKKVIDLTDEVTVVPAKESKIIKKKRKFGLKEFSRAPLREVYDDEKVNTPSKKKALKKLEIKD